MSEFLWFFSDHPVTAVQPNDLRLREERFDDGKRIVGDIVGLCSSYYEYRLVEAGILRVSQWKVTQSVERRD